MKQVLLTISAILLAHLSFAQFTTISDGLNHLSYEDINGDGLKDVSGMNPSGAVK